jgi:hypothetical protein
LTGVSMGYGPVVRTICQADHDAADREEVLEASLEAEQRTGMHEQTPTAARSHLLVRLGRIAAGAGVLLVGFLLLVLPGPGIALIIAGLSILAIDIPFAKRVRDGLAERSNRATAFVPQPLKRVLLVAVIVIGVALSCAFLLGR